MANIPLKCIAGRCPVVGCDRDGECYLWRCKYQRAPGARKPPSAQDDDARSTARALLIAATICVVFWVAVFAIIYKAVCS